MNSLERVVRLGIELIEGRRIDEVMDLFHKDCVMVMPNGDQLEFEAIRGVFLLQMESFPDSSRELVDWVESGDKIACVTHVRGTHRGVFMGPVGPIPPTGRAVQWRACDLLTFRGNKIAHWQAFMDLTGIVAQITGVDA
jgi:predicted ester cyclase